MSCAAHGKNKQSVNVERLSGVLLGRSVYSSQLSNGVLIINLGHHEREHVTTATCTVHKLVSISANLRM